MEEIKAVKIRRKKNTSAYLSSAAGSQSAKLSFAMTIFWENYIRFMVQFDSW